MGSSADGLQPLPAMADILIFTSTLLIGVFQVLHKLTYRSDNSHSLIVIVR